MGDSDAGQPSGKKRAETRYCRVPQWLYSAGVSLQAIAAYGWLHGRYGFLPVINPSYATLAEELHCSRGSVITYLKELVRVGAIRINVGGPKGRTINTYEIAFDAPFPVSGQSADHLKGAESSQVVSGLTTTGQPADQSPGQSGQRAVPEEEVVKNGKTLSARMPRQPQPSPAPVERETVASQDKLTTAQRIVRTAAVVAEADEDTFIAWVRAKHPPAGPQFWRKVSAQGDLPELVEAWRADQPSRPTLSLIPDWCGHCNRGQQPASIAERINETTDGRIEQCRACHPARRAAA